MRADILRYLTEDPDNLRSLVWTLSADEERAQELLDEVVEDLTRTWPTSGAERPQGATAPDAPADDDDDEDDDEPTGSAAPDTDPPDPDLTGSGDLGPARSPGEVPRAWEVLAEHAGPVATAAVLIGTGVEGWRVRDALKLTRREARMATPVAPRPDIPPTLRLRPFPRRRHEGRITGLTVAAAVLALLAGVGGWVAADRRDPGHHPQPVAATTSVPTPTTSRRMDRVPFDVPEGARPVDLALPPSLATAMSGDYDQEATWRLRVTRGDDGSVQLTETTPGGQPAALTVRRWPHGWWTAQSRTGLHLVVQTLPDSAWSWRALRPAATRRQVVQLGRLTGTRPGIVVEAWSGAVRPDDFVRAIAWRSQFYADDGKLLTSDERIAGFENTYVGTDGFVPPQGCPAGLTLGDVIGGRLEVTATLPGAGRLRDVRVVMNDPAAQATMSSVYVPTTKGQLGSATFVVRVPASYPPIHAASRRAVPGLGIAKLTWRDASGAAWVWDKASLDNVHRSWTCPRRA